MTKSFSELKGRYRDFIARRMNGKPIAMTPPPYDSVYYEALMTMNSEDDYPLGEDVTEMSKPLLYIDRPVIVSVPFTREEFEVIERASRESGHTISDVIRERALHG